MQLMFFFLIVLLFCFYMKCDDLYVNLALHFGNRMCVHACVGATREFVSEVLGLQDYTFFFCFLLKLTVF
jgi:glycerol uptake facilitator-like aquaporin